MKNINLKLFILTLFICILAIGGIFVNRHISSNKILEVSNEVSKYNNLITTIQNKEQEKPEEVKDYQKYLDIYPIDKVNDRNISEFFDILEIKNNLKISEKSFVVEDDHYVLTTKYSIYYKDLEKYYKLVDEVMASDLCIDNNSISFAEKEVDENGKKVKYYDLTITYNVYYYNTGTLE